MRVSTGQTHTGSIGLTLTALNTTTDSTITPVREPTLEPFLGQQNSAISSTLFPSLQHTLQQNENHYEISNTESNPYHYAMGSGLLTFSINHEMQEDATTEFTANAVNEADIQTIQTYRHDNGPSINIMSMNNRPLPHRPISLGIPEGPSLPPRARHGPFTLSTMSKPNTISHKGACSVDYNSMSDEVQQCPLDIISSNITHYDGSTDADENSIPGIRADTQNVADVDSQLSSSLTATQIINPNSVATKSTLTMVREPNSDSMQPDLDQNSVTSTSLFPSVQQHIRNRFEISTTDSNPYHYAIGSSVLTFSSMNHPTEDLRLNLTAGGVYEEADIQTGHIDNEQGGQRTEMMSMLNRPLPHRPISVGIPEGPTLPPRTKHGPISSSTKSTSKANLNNPHTGACSVEYNSITDEVEFQSDSSVIMNSNNTQRHCLREESEHIIPRTSERAQHVADTNSDPAASSRASAYHGYYSADDLQLGEGNNGAQIPLSNPDPFYHCLENDNPEGCSNVDVLLEYGSNDHDDDRDACNNNAMVDNILYNPLPF